MITLRPIHSAGRNLGVESKFGSGVNNECSRKECISVNFHIVLTKQSPCTGGGGGGCKGVQVAPTFQMIFIVIMSLLQR